MKDLSNEISILLGPGPFMLPRQFLGYTKQSGEIAGSDS
jgi:hypothetical protein